MKKTMIILAAVLLAGCGDVGEFSRKEGAEHKTETTPAFTFAPADEAAEEAADTTSSAEESEAETAAETTVGKKKAKTTTKKAEEAAVTTKIPENTQAAGANDTDTAQQTEQPKETLATPTVQPRNDPKTDDKPSEEKKVPDFYPDIYQPARFVSQSFEANWENYEMLRDGYKAVIRSADELVDYMLPIYPMDFIQERVNFYTNEILGGENFFDDNVLIVNTLLQGSGTAPMVQIDRVEPSDSMINIKYSWKYEEGCAYADVMSVCFLQVTAGKDHIKDKGIHWTIIDGHDDCYILTEEDRSIFERLKSLEYTPVTCDGLPEYTLSAPDGSYYQINLSGKWVWKNMKDEEAQLPDELVSWLKANGERIGMTVATWN